MSEQPVGAPAVSFHHSSISSEVSSLMGSALEAAWEEVQLRGYGAANDADRVAMALVILRLACKGVRDIARMRDAALGVVGE
jgi:hypothetical protein